MFALRGLLEESKMVIDYITKEWLMQMLISFVLGMSVAALLKVIFS